MFLVSFARTYNHQSGGQRIKGTGMANLQLLKAKAVL